MVNDLEIPSELKVCIIGLIGIRSRAEELKHGQMWSRLVNAILVTLYREYRSEWIKLFERYDRQFGPVKGVYDNLSTVNPGTKKSDFIAKPCEGCTTKEIEAYQKTGKLPERMQKGKKVKDIVDARTSEDVLAYFGQGTVSEHVLMTNLKAYAEGIGVRIHENTRNPRKVANQILDAIVG